MRIVDGYKLLVANMKAGVLYRVAWGEWRQGEPVLNVTYTKWRDGVVRITANVEGQGDVWCERMPCTGDNVLDYVRPLYDPDYKMGNNGYYVEWPTDPNGERGTHRHNPDHETAPNAVSTPYCVMWRECTVDL